MLSSLVSSTGEPLLAAIQFLAGLIFGKLGVGGLVAVAGGAGLVLSTLTTGVKFISGRHGMLISGVATLAGLGMISLTPPTTIITHETLRVVREIAPPLLEDLQLQIKQLETEARNQQAMLTAQAEVARLEAKSRAEEAARLQKDVQGLAAASQQPKQEAKPKTPAPTGECIACGHLMHVGRGLIGQNIRCGNCDTIMSARKARSRRSYTLNAQAGRIVKPTRPASPMFADMSYRQMYE